MPPERSAPHRAMLWAMAKHLNPAAVELGRLGGTARAAKLSKAQRLESARNAAAARWAGHTAKRPASSRKKKR